MFYVKNSFFFNLLKLSKISSIRRKLHFVVFPSSIYLYVCMYTYRVNLITKVMDIHYTKHKYEINIPHNLTAKDKHYRHFFLHSIILFHILIIHLFIQCLLTTYHVSSTILDSIKLQYRQLTNTSVSMVFIF